MKEINIGVGEVLYSSLYRFAVTLIIIHSPICVKHVQ
jgi:hypothetical protein